VFWPRPAQATLDFIDVERIEVLRGPQGTLFGKNTTAGAVNVTTKKPSFTPESEFEISAGDYGLIQTKLTATGPITDRIAGRLSFSGTQRDGMLRNVSRLNTKDDLNDTNNLGVRGQLLFNVADNLEVILAGDYTRQRPEGYAQVPVRVVPTYRTANRQVFGIIESLNATQPGLNYSIPQPIVSQQTITATTVNGVPSGPSGILAEFDPFVRVSDADVAHRSYQNIDGEHRPPQMGLVSLQRPRLPRSADHDAIRQPFDTGAEKPGTPLCGRVFRHFELCRRRVRLPSNGGNAQRTNARLRGRAVPDRSARIERLYRHGRFNDERFDRGVPARPDRRPDATSRRLHQHDQRGGFRPGGMAPRRAAPDPGRPLQLR
jgi:hypothetical protein